MHAKPYPEIDPADLKAVRHFLTSLRDEERSNRTPRDLGPLGPVPLRRGIARARNRSRGPKAEA
ncbi:MAG: hypothetical protein IRY99_10060 [Isosphaeraceae bacterium]|nr:hypothetical protein [Isosphaeraceae bacterium]